MKKLNMIIGKRQIIIASLVLILGVAVYLNWQFASSDQALTVADVLGTGTQTTEGPTSSSTTYGQAEQVDTQPTDDYFTRARLDKQNAEAETSDSLNTLLAQTDLSDEERAAATEQAMDLTQMSEQESAIESQVMAKGFSDCIAYVEAGRVNVTVKSGDLDAQQANQIKDIVVSTTGADPSNIVVTPVE